MRDDHSGRGALTGVRVIDLADELAAYASRLLADLGADVIRVEPPEGSSTRREPPFVDGPNGAASAFDLFVNAGKRSVVVDLETPAGPGILAHLLRSADILIETLSAGRGDRAGLDPATVAAANPRLVHVTVTPFGRDRTGEDVDDDDLTIMAAGGLLHFGGYPETGPVIAYGGQARNAASLFAAVAALVALLRREETGRGDWIDVSAQECVAQALEDAVPTYEMTGRVRRRLGSDPREAGTGVYPCADGLVSMVAGRVGTAKAWRALVEWLVESGVDGAVRLEDPEWSSITHRQQPDSIAFFSSVFGAFARTRTRLELYRGAQSRGIALSPVNDIAQLLEDPQLAARQFWSQVDEPLIGAVATVPGPPYRLSRTPARPARPAPSLGQDTEAVLGAEPAIPAR
jgi:benzylsuccinate CoA-transferase BbsE subunit